VEVKGSRPEVIDYRNEQDLSQILSTLREHPSIMVWAEGEQKKLVGGKDRNELVPAEALVLWTIPPSPQELHLALEKVHPKTVYLMGTSAPIETPETFITRLAGLLKTVINARTGKVSWSVLAAATAQRLVTVRTGLQWLVSQGTIAIDMENGDDLVVSKGASGKDSPDSANLWAEMKILLAETAAYREHFKQADKNSLLE
jgi:hypothetical protein